MEASLIVSILSPILTIIGGVIVLVRKLGAVETTLAVTSTKLDALSAKLDEHVETDTKNFEALNARLNGSARLYRKASATKRKSGRKRGR